MRTPLVSVVIPTYERAASIRASIDSVLAQTMSDLEIIVVDDGSTDGTVDLVRAIPDPRVRVIVHETNRGGNAARQTGIDAAQGTWVAFLDSDDRWVETKLARQLDRLAELGPDYRFCYTWYDVELADGSFLRPREVHVEGMHRPELITSHQVGTFSTMVIDRNVLLHIGGLDKSLPACQDWDLVLRANDATGICVVPEVLVHYRHGAGNANQISGHKSAVIEGHCRLYERICIEYPQLSTELMSASQRYIMAALAQQGAVTDVIRIVRDLARNELTLPNAGYSARMLARATRRRISSSSSGA